MKPSPQFRAACHRALDILLAALEEEEQPEVLPPKRKRQPRAALTIPVPQPNHTPEQRAYTERFLQRAGLGGIL